MDALIFLVALCALAAFVAAPLYRRAESTQADPTAAELEARRDALTATLRELELDRASGLLDEADYRRERAHLEAELLEVLEAPGAHNPAEPND